MEEEVPRSPQSESEEPASRIRILEEWRRAFRAKDISALASLYGTDAYLEVSDLSLQAYGKSSIVKALSVLVGDSVELDIEWKVPVLGQRLICAEYVVSGGILDGRGVAIIGIEGDRIAFDKRFVTRDGEWRA